MYHDEMKKRAVKARADLAYAMLTNQIKTDMKVGDEVLIKLDADLTKVCLGDSCYLLGAEGVITEIDTDFTPNRYTVAFNKLHEEWVFLEDMLVVSEALVKEDTDKPFSITNGVMKTDHDLDSTKGYLAFHKEFCEEMMEISERKNHDYAGHGDGNPFANFELVEKMGALQTEWGFITRMTDKVSRLMTFIKKGVLKVKGEGIRDALMDLANYCILLAGYIERKRQRKEKEKHIDKYPLTFGEANCASFKGDVEVFTDYPVVHADSKADIFTKDRDVSSEH